LRKLILITTNIQQKLGKSKKKIGQKNILKVKISFYL